MEGFKSRPDAKSQAYHKFRHRPHLNPLADLDFFFPCQHPSEFPFDKYYDVKPVPNKFTLIDIGCGYGDFAKNMGQYNPTHIILGLEIRDKAAAIAQQQLLDARTNDKICFNVAVIRCNVMRQLPYLLGKQSVQIFTIMFPDPQFKNANERRRVVSPILLNEYAYYLQNDGYLLVCSDVQELANYMVECISQNDNFVNIPVDGCSDQLVQCALKNMDNTADAQRHQRKDDDKRVFKSVWKKV